MDSRKLISKIAVDRESKKLGKIIQVELLPGKTIKKNIPYIMILVSKPLKRNIVIPIEAERVVKFDTQYAWINITKEEFEKEVKRTVQIQKEREKYSGHIPIQKMGNHLRGGVDYTALSKASKERKR